MKPLTPTISTSPITEAENLAAARIYLLLLRSRHSWCEHKAALARLSSDLILHVINNTVDILPCWKGNFVSLEKYCNHETNLRQSQCFANAVSVACSHISSITMDTGLEIYRTLVSPNYIPTPKGAKALLSMINSGRLVQRSGINDVGSLKPVSTTHQVFVSVQVTLLWEIERSRQKELLTPHNAILWGRHFGVSWYPSVINPKALL